MASIGLPAAIKPRMGIFGNGASTAFSVDALIPLLEFHSFVNNPASLRYFKYL